MGDRRISRKSKGNLLSSCVTPVYMNALATIAVTEKQPEKVQVCENYLVRIGVLIKRLIRENGCRDVQ